jgi:hypothetical protein
MAAAVVPMQGCSNWQTLESWPKTTLASLRPLPTPVARPSITLAKRLETATKPVRNWQTLGCKTATATGSNYMMHVASRKLNS